MRVPQVHKASADLTPQGIERKNLGKWVDYQRQSYWRRVRGQKAGLCDERIRLLEEIGFEWKSEFVFSLPRCPLGIICLTSITIVFTHLTLQVIQKLPVMEKHEMKIGETEEDAIETLQTHEGIMLNLHSVFDFEKEKEPDQTTNEHLWLNQYEQLVRYKNLTGTDSIVYKKHPDADIAKKLKSLYKWVAKQRPAYQRYKRGEASTMTSTRAQLLDQIQFDSEARLGRPVNYRGWNEKLEQLKEFKTLNGHCRVPHHGRKKDKGPAEIRALSKWVEHQRAAYWRRMRGEKSSLSNDRIAALNAIGMEWRLIKNLTSPSHQTADPGLKTEENHSEGVGESEAYDV